MFAVPLSKAVGAAVSATMKIFTPVNALLDKKTEKIKNARKDCLMSLAVISDIHLDEKCSFISDGMFELGLADMEKAEDRLSAVAFVGDMTNHGYIGQWDIFTSSVRRHDISDNVFVVVGNHDTWGPNREDFFNPADGVEATFIKYNKASSGREIDKMYYSGSVNGFPFIVLGSEKDNVNAYLSESQLSWFEREMEKAGQTGKPVFVLMHQPLNFTHGLPYTWEKDSHNHSDTGGIGPQSDAVRDILKKYDNVFYVSGHIHSGLKNKGDKRGPAYASVEYMKNDYGRDITLINLPCFANPDIFRGGHFSNGCGYVLEVYADKVLIRARNFGAGTYLKRYDCEAPLYCE